MSLPPAPLSPAAIALNRFGLGARPDDAAPADPKGWLTGQFAHFEVEPEGFAKLPDAGQAVESYLEQTAALRRQATTGGGTPDKDQLKTLRQDFGKQANQLYRAGVKARADSALATEAPFVERLVHFWANHFCISADNPQLAAFAPAFERDAIRPHVLGRFKDMLFAVERHPAMLIYLNQVTSVGPDSPLAQRVERRNPKRKLGINENLGRETLELHTLGVRSGYTQADVTEYSRALTGWTVDGFGPGQRGDGSPDSFVFRPELHEPGPRTVLGKRYDQEGEQQAMAMLTDLAKSPHTANHVAEKLARHFAGDTPPPALVARLADSFLKSGGDLPTLYRTLIASPEPWNSAPLKFKTPWEWLISVWRGSGRRELGNADPAGLMTQLGQPVWRPRAPAGWDDVAASWAAPDALLRRVDIAQRLVAPAAAELDARQLGPALFPGSLSPATAEQIARAESPTSALALLMVSPDFLRR
ncbi:MAG TPA: DUF1800 domain-containing protein [Devosia sp.]|nr:DUF1800 domain-containing protein [Devosia sp.]